MVKCRKKPQEYEAFMFSGVDFDNWPWWMQYAWNKFKSQDGSLYERDGQVYLNSDGHRKVSQGDILVKGKDDRIKVFTKEEFEELYELM